MYTPSHEYTDADFARVALWLDDPYGDGIRLSIIRNPSPARIAATEFAKSGQRTITNDEQQYIDRGREYLSDRIEYKKHQKLVLQQGIIGSTTPY